ncbi:MAG TPA: hypothetical protein VGN16_19490 [Acidobacteriaceae bacterium]|jgi:hypothetical protein
MLTRPAIVFSVLAALLWTCTLAVSAQSVMSARTLIEAEQQRGFAGTSVEPASTPVPMWMGMRGNWMFMLHANAFASNTQQQADSPRNRDAFFSTNWIMPMAQRSFGENGRGGTLTLRTMFSLEPGAMSGREYPELFQQGETAFGKPIVDGQHPHDFIMEVGALYDLKLSHNTLLSLYAAPVGDPAIGPTAYPHRLSASENPIAALGHHQEDSTHIAFNVFTGGLTYKWVRAELSGFHGGEPGEAHWHFEPSSNGHAVDSVSTRVTVAPTADWMGQYSIAHIASPEALYPGEDQQRQTASIMYHHTFRSKPTDESQTMPGMDMSGMKDMPGMDMSGTAAQPSHAMSNIPGMHTAPEPTLDLSTSAIWGRTRSLTDNSKENSYLLEALLRFGGSNYTWTRLENAGRSNELLLTPGAPLPAAFAESPVGHVAAFTFGYDHDIKLGSKILAAPGAQFTVYRTPAALVAAYGDTPTAETFFVRFRLH